MPELESEGSLHARTRELLNSSGIPYLVIFQATDLSPNWLSRFACGKIVDPSVNRVQRLYEYLSEKPLGVR